MLVVRTILAVAMTVCGGVILVRVAALGLHIESAPGLILGIAMIALGVHRLSLIAGVRRGTSP